MCVLRQCNYLPAAAKCVWVSVKQQKIEREKQKNRKIYKKDRKVCVCVGNRVRKRHLSGFIDNSSKKNYVILRGEKKYFLSQNVFFFVVVVVVTGPIFKIHWKSFGWNRWNVLKEEKSIFGTWSLPQLELVANHDHSRTEPNKS